MIVRERGAEEYENRVGKEMSAEVETGGNAIYLRELVREKEKERREEGGRDGKAWRGRGAAKLTASTSSGA